MQCPSAGHPAVQAYCRHANEAFAPDEHHRCNLKECKYWPMPGVHRGGVRFYVCTRSLHVHACSPNGCGLHVASYNGLGADGAYYCELSGLEMKQVDYVSAPVERRSNPRTGGVSWVKTGCTVGSTARRAGKRKVTVSRAKVTAALVRTTALAIAATCRSNPRDKIKRILRRAPLRATFATVLHDVLLQCGVVNMAPDPPEGMVADVAAYCVAVQPDLKPATITPVVVAATVLSLLQTGLVCGKVTVFPKDPWVAQHLPSLTMYGAVPGLQCRQMSVCTRAIKRLVFANGVVLPKYVFTAAADAGNT